MEEYYSKKKTYWKVTRGRLSAVQSLLPAGRPLSVLDVGCGGGAMGEHLKKDKDVSVFGSDISAAAVEEAKKRLNGAWQMDLEHPESWPSEIATSQFDVVILSEVLEHLFFPEHALAALKKLMGGKSTAIITVPNILFWRNRLSILLGHFEYTDTGLMDRGHIHFFSWKSFCDLLAQEGFRITATRHHMPTRLFKPFARFFPGLFAFQFIVRVEKNA